MRWRVKQHDMRVLSGLRMGSSLLHESQVSHEKSQERLDE